MEDRCCGHKIDFASEKIRSHFQERHQPSKLAILTEYFKSNGCATSKGVNKFSLPYSVTFCAHYFCMPADGNRPPCCIACWAAAACCWTSKACACLLAALRVFSSVMILAHRVIKENASPVTF